MIEEAKRIAASLRRCNKSECKQCKIGFRFGCATVLRQEAADMLENMAGKLEERATEGQGKSDNVDAFK